MSRKCAKCGIVSEIEESFQKSDYSDKIFYCPACREINAIQLGDSYLKACIIVLIGGLVWVMLSPQNEFAWLVFQAGLMMCFINILTLPHELGHTLAAFLTKANIFQVTIGVGKILYKRDFLGIEWIFRAVPFCGYTLIGFNNRSFFRLRSFLASSGGPLSNFLLIFAATFLLFNVSSQWLLALIRSFIAANVFELLYELLPRKVNFAGTTTQSDGLTLLTVPFMSHSKINQEIEANFVWQVYSSYMKGRVEDAKQSYEKGMALFPNSSALKNEMGNLLLYLGQYTEARNLFVQLQQKTDLGPDMRIGILNSIATADVMIGGNDLLEEADAFSKTACENMPWQTEFKWARGLVLVKKGHIEQGLTLLKEVMDKTENSSQKAMYASYIAEFENKKSNAV